MFENIPYIGTIVLIFVCVNIALTAAHEILGKIKDKTETTADDKAFSVIGKIAGFVQGIVGWLSANTKK